MTRVCYGIRALSERGGRPGDGVCTFDFLESFFMIMRRALLPDMDTFSSCCKLATSWTTPGFFLSSAGDFFWGAGTFTLGVGAGRGGMALLQRVGFCHTERVWFCKEGCGTNIPAARVFMSGTTSIGAPARVQRTHINHVFTTYTHVHTHTHMWQSQVENEH